MEFDDHKHPIQWFDILLDHIEWKKSKSNLHFFMGKKERFFKWIILDVWTQWVLGAHLCSLTNIFLQNDLKTS